MFATRKRGNHVCVEKSICVVKAPLDMPDGSICGFAARYVCYANEIEEKQIFRTVSSLNGTFVSIPAVSSSNER